MRYYRITIWREESPGKMVFDHYATEAEMGYLRVSNSGCVERLREAETYSYYSGYAEYKIDVDSGIETNVCLGWEDVSDTHRVEMGVMVTTHYGNNAPPEALIFYENDIVKDVDEDTYGVVDDSGCDCGFGVDFGDYDNWQAIGDVDVEVVGNIHENAALLIGVGGLACGEYDSETKKMVMRNG